MTTAVAQRPGRLAPVLSGASRLLSGASRRLRHEWFLVGVGAVLLSVVMNWLLPPVTAWLFSTPMSWPGFADPRTTIPEDLWDPTLTAWMMSWAGHALTHDPVNLWHSNTFYPEQYSYAFSDSLLGYAPIGAIGTGAAAAVLRYNIVYTLVFALAFVGAYALVRQLGAGRIAAAVAGAAFAYAPWRLGQAGHLHVISSGAIPLALAMLARGHGWSLQRGYRRELVRPGWVLAGWLVAAWQITLGFGIGLAFGYALALVGLVAIVRWLSARRRGVQPELPRRMLLADVCGGAFFAATGALMAYPYLQVTREFPDAKRSWADLAAFSPPLRGFFVAPPESLLWGSAHEGLRGSLRWWPEMALLPGYALIALAAVGLVYSIWTRRQRQLLGCGVGVSVLLAMGSKGLIYRAFYDTLPGFDAIRTSGRLVLWTTLLLGVLAAGCVSRIGLAAASAPTGAGTRAPGRRRLLALAAALPLLLVLAEGLNRTAHPEVPLPPAALATAEAPLLVLPSDPSWGQLTDENVMLWGTDRFPAMVNGASGFIPPRLLAVREAALNFPDATSVAMLRELGVRTVIVLRNPPWWGMRVPQNMLDAPIDGLGITRHDEGDVIVYALG